MDEEPETDDDTDDVEKCPVCGSEDGDEDSCSDCNFLLCPICKHPVSWYGTESIESGVSECEHVVMWGVIDGDGPFFGHPEYEDKFATFLKQPGRTLATGNEHGSYSNDYEAFAHKEHLEYCDQSDGYSMGTAYFLFAK